ncbi:hypothetical protein F971_01984 [Acinetobacter vivianii]|uniref:Phage protein n=1 Tax=Acinetobacter vivianii TaxID=1776742 RepID=N8W9X3_9GAMM|nr:phage tail terminator-like protein [Acinetobacter vivianii]ENU92097.1 hypothetical protein F971_01984 [Acinetobacter vivianii]
MAAMTIEEARIAINERMRLFKGISQDCIAYPNVSFDPPNNGLWCRLNIIFGKSFTAGLAKKPVVRRTGTINIQCFARPNTGTKEMSILNTALLEHFEFFSVGHLEFSEGEAVYAGTSNDFDMYNVIVGFRVN